MKQDPPEVVVHELDPGLYIAIAQCQKCGLNYNQIMQPGYSYYLYCPPCAEEMDITVEHLRPKDKSNE